MNKIENIIKRDGRAEVFNVDKIITAITKAWIEVGEKVDKRIIKAIATDVQTLVASINGNPTVEEIQDAVELKLADKYPKVAIAYAKYRTRQEIKRTEGWNLSDLGKRIYESKYKFKGENFNQFLDRVSNGNSKIRKQILNKCFLFGGRILAGRGMDKYGIKVTYSNCYVIPEIEDNLESIFDSAKRDARIFSYGGGSGSTIKNLRPKKMKVHNSAGETTGSVSFLKLYNTTTELIGQKGRRGAKMLDTHVKHPDIFEFIDAKCNEEGITKANLSIRITDEFMNAVHTNDMWMLEYECVDTGEKFEHEVHAVNLYNAMCLANWDWAEPGSLFWDRIEQWCITSADDRIKFAGVNPCAEEPLPAWGACLLGSINLSSFVLNPFTDKATYDINAFVECVHDSVRALNEVLDEGIPLHPFKEQQDMARGWRQIGLGVFGVADMFLMLGHQYGSKESISISKTLAFTMLNEAVVASCLLAKEQGAYPMFDAEKILASEFIKTNIAPDVQMLIQQCGLRNSQLLTIAPTGSLSNMFGVSGGIEPIYDTSYERKTESLGEGDEYFKIFTPVVAKYLEAHPELEEKDIATAMNLDWHKRIEVQSAWQQFIDASISSTVNLPKSTTVEEVKELYMYAWQWGLKGITIYRDGCKRSGVMAKAFAKDEITDGKTFCPECGKEMIHTGGCATCNFCGYSPCDV